ncbi:MAG: peptidoglycan-associated lipoprotein [Myxococcota bacterium]|jgi:peptidoglycan-associated lipoprotein
MFAKFLYRHRYMPAAFGVFLLVGADGKGCKCKDTEIPPDVIETAVAAPAVALQVVSVNPSRVEAGQATSATLYGSAFVQGATINIGTVAATGVRVTDAGTLSMTVPALAEGRYDVQVRLPNGDSATLRNGLTSAVSAPSCSTTTVYFDTARDGLTAATKSSLDADVGCYTARTDTLRLEGHADERGTTDYNLALGQRRAESVKRYLTSEGVPAARVQTLSYGEERPSDRGHTEAAWSKNRRVQINVGQ